MIKQIIYNPEARLRLLQGMDTVARAARVTLGSAGCTVLIQHRTDGIAPVLTRNGAIVANAIVLPDRIADLGARMLREVAGLMSRQVGDGTTTAIVLAHTLAKECVKSITAGFHPLHLQKGLELALMRVEHCLKQQAVTGVSADWIAKIASVASKQEPGVGDLLATALTDLGPEGTLTFQYGNGREDKLEIVEGIQYAQGYLSSYFVTDKIRQEAVLEQPYILLYDREITDLMDLVPLLEQVAEQQRSLLVIAENVQDQALTGLLLNCIRGVFKVVAVKPPGYGDKRIARLNDLALLTGGTAILEDQGMHLAQTTLAQLGQAQRAVVTADSTAIVGVTGDSVLLTQTVDHLKGQIEVLYRKRPGQGSTTGNRHDAEELEERLTMLSGKTGTFSVGGCTDIEIKERLVRIENAFKSAKAALEEGVMPGGGIGLYRCTAALSSVFAENPEQQQGLVIMRQALAAPLKQLLQNSRINSESVIARLQADPQAAFDTESQRYGDFLQIGILDAVKVTRLGLRHAVGLIGTLMCSEAVVMSVPDHSIMAGYSPEWAAATREDPRQ